MPRLASLYNHVLENLTREEADMAVDLLTRMVAKLDMLGER